MQTRRFFTQLAILSILYSLPVFTQSIEVNDTIWQDVVWDVDTVFVTGDVVIPDSFDLTISPGTKVMFNGEFFITFQGDFFALGTQEDSIFFKSNNPAGWKALQFNGPSGREIRFQHCSFSGAKGAIAAIIITNSADVSIANCFFYDCKTAIDIRDTDPIIESCHFHSGNTGIHTTNSYPEISNSYFSNLNGIALSLSSSDGEITNSIFCNNYLGIRLRNSDALLGNCLIVNNNGNGLEISRSNPRIINSIITGNSILEITDAVSRPEFSNCIIRDSILDVSQSALLSNIIDDNANFADPSDGTGSGYNGRSADWHLTDSSPGINNGRYDPSLTYSEFDFDGLPRIKHGIIDIGPYEYYNDTLAVEGDIDSDTQWIADTIRIYNHVHVYDSTLLTISPGAYVEIQGDFEINIYGSLKAVGTPESRIRFTIKDTSGFFLNDSLVGGWSGINFENPLSSPDSTIMENCIIEYCKSQGDGVAMSIDYQAPIQVSNCEFRYNKNIKDRGSIICVHSPSLVFRNNDIHHNFDLYQGTGFSTGGMKIERGADVLIENNIFQHNLGNTSSSLVCRSEAVIQNNIFTENTGLECAGIYIRASEPMVLGNSICNNFGTAINVNTQSDPKIYNNIICNNINSNSSALFVGTGNKPLIVNNTICNNHCDSDSGVAITLMNRSEAIFHNNIIWGNSANLSGFYQMMLLGENFATLVNNIIQNGESAISIDNFQGTIENIYVFNPAFGDPSNGTGPESDGLAADWSVLSISKAIDKGSIPDIAIDFPEFDYRREPRISNGKIDLGALEKQYLELKITSYPSNLFKCESDSAVFSISLNDTAFYQWQKDGIDLPGATSPELKIDSVRKVDNGNFSCLINNSFSAIESPPVYQFVTETPAIISSPDKLWSSLNSDVDLTIYARGTDLDYQWKRNDAVIPNAKSPNLKLKNLTYEDEGVYTCIVHNDCGADTSGAAQLNLAPHICMVTVSPTSGHNLVVWEKKSTAPIIAYNIYRESVAAGIYDRLVSVPYDELSVFVDTTADPTVQAYLYKITAIDTSGMETDIDLCKPHKTIHLIVSTNPELNTTQLQWDRYYGFDYQTYTIYKSTTGVNFDPVHSLSASLNSWTDPQASTGDLFYRIAVEKPDPCVPEGSGKKAGTGPYVHALSNMDDNKLKAGQLPPDSIIITNNSISEESMPGTTIGKLFTEDADTNDSHTYQFISGPGDDNNTSFTLLGDLLLASESFDFETKNQYSIRIRSTDKAGGYCEVPFLIEILDVNEATGLPTHNVNTLVIYPNPFNHSTTISFPNPAGTTYQMILTDLSGKVVHTMETTSERFTQERNGLRAGIYMIEIKGEKTLHGKIVIAQ